MAAEMASLFVTEGFGDALTVAARASGTYDTATGTSTVTTTAYTTTGKIFDYKAYQVDGNFVLKGDRKAVLLGNASAWTPSPYIPNPGDTITFGSAIWNIVDVKPVMLQGVTVAIVCQIRGSSRG